MDAVLQDRLRGAAVGAAVGDALGMPLEFGPSQPLNNLVRDMRSGRMPAGTFTDDTEMALALAGSLLEKRLLDGANLADHFLGWYRSSPPDVGIHTSLVLSAIRRGAHWQSASESAYIANPQNAGNGSVMRCWPVALASHNDPDRLIQESILQSQVTHYHPECCAACVFVNLAIIELAIGQPPAQAVETAIRRAGLPAEAVEVLRRAPQQPREMLVSSGWVRHTLESAVWGLLTSDSFEEAVVKVANLGNDADTAASVTGALAGAAYGLSGIPARWRESLRGRWPPASPQEWREEQFIQLADRLMG